MKIKVSVPNAERQITEIALFIERDNSAAAERYVRSARRAFDELDDTRLPVRASENLPRDVRRIFVTGFKGYTLRVLYRGEYIALVAAFRPGLTGEMQDEGTWPGVAEFHRDHE